MERMAGPANDSRRQVTHSQRWFFFLRLGITLALFIYIFAWLIEYDDRIALRSGQLLVGKFIKQTSQAVLLQPQGAKPRWISYAQIKTRQGRLVGLMPGFFTVLRTIDLARFLPLTLLFLCSSFLVMIRWFLLLRSQGLAVPFTKVVRLGFMGLFFNNFLLGIVGGDLIKAYYIARDTSAKMTAVISVLVDRMIGLLALVLLAGVFLLNLLARPGFGIAAGVIYGTLLAIVIFVLLVLYGPQHYGIKLPVIDKAREALRLYRHHGKTIGLALLISCGIHLCNCSAIYGFGRALDIQIDWMVYFVYAAVTFVLTSLPISIAGWGLNEYLYSNLFSQVGVNPAQAVVLAIVYRLTMTAWGCIGGIFYLLGEQSAVIPLDHADGAQITEAACSADQT